MILLWQSDDEYPMLKIMVSDNPAYRENRLAVTSKEEALKHITAWLNKKVPDESGTKVKQPG